MISEGKAMLPRFHKRAVFNGDDLECMQFAECIGQTETIGLQLSRLYVTSSSIEVPLSCSFYFLVLILSVQCN